jgi:hypothetical protein
MTNVTVSPTRKPETRLSPTLPFTTETLKAPASAALQPVDDQALAARCDSQHGQRRSKTFRFTVHAVKNLTK